MALNGSEHLRQAIERGLIDKPSVTDITDRETEARVIELTRIVRQRANWKARADSVIRLAHRITGVA